MNKKKLFVPLFFCVIYIISSSYSKGGKALLDSDGTGAKGAGGCSCHSNMASTDLTLTMQLFADGQPVNSYVGGKTYTIKIKGVNNTTYTLPKFGFRLTTVFAAGAGTNAAVNGGTLAASGLPEFCQNTNVKSFHIIEHNTQIPATSGEGEQGTIYEESIPWLAPDAGSGSIKLFGVLLAVNGDKTVKGDKWNKVSVLIPEGAELPKPEAPAQITGNTQVCLDKTTTFASTKEGGIWRSSNTNVATINANTGTITPKNEGTTRIIYKIGTEEVTKTITINGTPVAEHINGLENVCVGSSIMLTDAAQGGKWSSTNTDIATISDNGELTGIDEGNTTVYYIMTNACGTDFKTKLIKVKRRPYAGVIKAPATDLCIGTAVTLSNTEPGGIWSTTNEIAAVTGTGKVVGLRPGIDTVVYTVKDGLCAASTQKTLTFFPKTQAGVISGPWGVKLGKSVTLQNNTPGGIWSSNSDAAAISSTGVVFGLTEGEATISYSLGDGPCPAVSTHKISVVTKDKVDTYEKGKN